MNHAVQANFVLVLANEEFTRQGNGADLSGNGGDTIGNAKLQEGYGENPLSAV